MIEFILYVLLYLCCLPRSTFLFYTLAYMLNDCFSFGGCFYFMGCVLHCHGNGKKQHVGYVLESV